MVQIIYFRNKCIGCGGCVEAAPHRWRMSKKDGKSNLIHGQEKNSVYQATVDPDELQANIAAAANCPVNIIKVNKL